MSNVISKGRISQIIGAVIDVSFPQSKKVLAPMSSSDFSTKPISTDESDSQFEKAKLSIYITEAGIFTLSREVQ